jgi:dihydroflavonol-4-reductase
MRALVLGGTGFIGGHVARAALEAGWSVRALRRDPACTGILQDVSVDWVVGDLDAPAGLETIFMDIDVVIHAAGYYPSDSKNVPSQVAHSMQQTTNVLDLMRVAKAKRLIYTSSYTTMVPSLEGREQRADEGDHYQPGMLVRSAYYECKAAMERVLFERQDKNIEIVILNPTLVLGPGGNTQGTGSAFLAMAQGWGVVWVPGKVNVVDVRDVALSHINAAQFNISDERFLLGGHNLSLRELMEIVAQHAGVRRPMLKLPLLLIDMLVWMEDHIPGVNVFANHLRAIRYWPYFSNQKAREMLDITFHSLEDTIIDTLDSYKMRGYL